MSNAAAQFTLRLHSHTVTFRMVDPANFAAGVSVNCAARIPAKDAEQIAVKLVRAGWRRG